MRNVVPDTDESSPRRLSALLGWVALCFLAPLSSIWARPDAWYAALSKPDWNPPGWVFGPVWTTLYILMGVAAWLVWRRGVWRARSGALWLFCGQLLLNALWTPLFFGLHRIDLALVDIVLLWLAIVATVVAFARSSVVAAWLLVPYLAWVSFASFLTFTIWKLNP